MRCLCAWESAAVVLLLIFFPSNSAGWGSDQSAPEQAARFASVRRFSPADFQQSRRDVLSGGIGSGLPYRMAVDSRGRILVTDPRLSIVHVLDEQGYREQIRGDRDHRLGIPAAIAVDASDRIYIADLQLSSIVVLEPDGTFARWIGAGLLKVPTGVGVDKRNRTLYVADWSRDEILCFDLEGTLLRVFGTFGTGPGQLNRPTGIAVHDDAIVVLDSGNTRFSIFDLAGRFREARPFGFTHKPTTFAFDNAGNLYIVDAHFRGLVAIDRHGGMFAGLAGPNLMCVTIDSRGRILTLNQRLEINVLQLETGPAE